MASIRLKRIQWAGEVGGERTQDGPGASTGWRCVMGPQEVILSFCLPLCVFEIFHNKKLF